eukprot:gene4667-3362_t
MQGRNMKNEQTRRSIEDIGSIKGGVRTTCVCDTFFRKSNNGKDTSRKKEGKGNVGTVSSGLTNNASFYIHRVQKVQCPRPDSVQRCSSVESAPEEVKR